MTRTKAFYFVSESLSEDDEYPLVFTNESNRIDGETQHCRFENLASLLGDCPATIVIPERLTSFHRVTLPLLSDKKAQAAIPYAIEDQSAQEVNELHFAYDRQFYNNGQYLVLSCDRSWLQNLIRILQQNQVEPKRITTAWFALSDNQCVIRNQFILCRSAPMNGAIPLSMLSMVEEPLFSTDDLSILSFNGVSDIPVELQDKVTPSEQSWEVWLSQQLSHSPVISLNQGAFATRKDETSWKRSLWFIGGSIAIWFMIWISTTLISLHHTNEEMQQVDDKIATIYRQFFPGARQVISPRFRISQQLKNKGTGEEVALLSLLDQLAIPLKANHVTPVQMNYQSQRITLKLVTNNFSQLEKFITALKKQSVKAKQIDANRNEDKVEATVELQL